MINVYSRIHIEQLLQVSCLLCRGPASFSQPVCHYCLESCLLIEHPCTRCGTPILAGNLSTCAQCQTTPPPYHQSHCAFLYSYPVDHIIHRVKYRNQINLIPPITRPLTKILQERYQQQSWPQAIIPIPLHKKRLQERGYDQALLIAKALRRQLRNVDINLDSKLIKQVKPTRPQQGLKARERRKNIRGAFHITKAPAYQHVALLDDVVTTGATVSEVAKLLTREGVKCVDIWSLARTVKT